MIHFNMQYFPLSVYLRFYFSIPILGAPHLLGLWWWSWSFSSFAGEYSCLMVNLTFKREFSYYLIQYYIPCCMLVIVSWVSFWLDQHAVPARVALGVTTLLTMSTQTAGINQSLPPVSYTKVLCCPVGCWNLLPHHLLIGSKPYKKKKKTEEGTVHEEDIQSLYY